MLLPAIAILFASRSGESTWQLVSALVFLPVALFALIRALSLRYRFDEHELVIRSGVIFRSVRHLPYNRIHNLDAVQKPLHRLLRVAEVRIETGGGAEAEAALQVISLDALDEMRREVLGRRAPASPPIEAAAPQPPPPEAEVILRLELRELLLSGFIHSRGILVIGALLGLISEFRVIENVLPGFVDDLGPAEGMLVQFGRALVGRGELPVAGLAIVLGVFMLLILVLRVLSMLWAAVTLHGYTLVHQGNDLRAQFGLLTRVTTTTPLKRVQALTVQEGPLHRLFERVTVRLQTVGQILGQAQGGATRETVAPILRKTSVESFVERVLPGIQVAAEGWRPPHRRAFRRLFIKSTLARLVLVSPIFYWNPTWAYLIVPCIIGWSALNARLHVKHTAWRATTDAVFFKSGWWKRQLTVVRMDRIQAVSLSETPFDRRHGMMTVQVDTLGATGAPHVVHIPYVARAEATDLMADLYQRAAGVPFTV